MLARAAVRPASQTRRAGKACQIDTDLGDDALRGAPVAAGDGVQQVDLSGERSDQPIDLDREILDRLVQKVELGRDLFHDEPMVGHEAALQCPTL
jgi:hypothetical protein